MTKIRHSKRTVTQIGSLPFTDVDEAIAYSLAHDIPFLPELTARGDAMTEYIKDPGRLSCLEAFKKNRFDVVKVQCIGPVTLIQCCYDEADAITRIYDHVDALLDKLQAEEIILFLDEPALGCVGFDFVRLWEPIFESFPVTRGVHTCGNMQWDQMFAAPIDIISFDASKFDITRYYKDRSNKRIAWGINAADQIRDYQQGDLLTGPCGLPHSNHTVDDAHARLAMLRDVAERLPTA
ncbi:hypothetical protein LR032_04530 [Candidatus Bipolaricaulota bacterium]|nr:hypothetical protein [Candidatus Bipolaricaulota bacterium]